MRPGGAQNPAQLSSQASLSSLFSTGTGTCVSNAVTLSKQTGVVTTESLSTAAGAKQTITVTNSLVSATSRIQVSLQGGTNTTRPALIGQVVPGTGSFTVDIENLHASAALNGTVKFTFTVL